MFPAGRAPRGIGASLRGGNRAGTTEHEISGARTTGAHVSNGSSELQASEARSFSERRRTPAPRGWASTCRGTRRERIGRRRLVLTAATAAAAILLVAGTVLVAWTGDDGGIRAKVPVRPGPQFDDRSDDCPVECRDASGHRSGRRLHRGSPGPRRRGEHPAYQRACRLDHPLPQGRLSPLRRRAPHLAGRDTTCRRRPSGLVSSVSRPKASSEYGPHSSPRGCSTPPSRPATSRPAPAASRCASAYVTAGSVEEVDFFYSQPYGDPPPEAVRLFDYVRTLDSTLPATHWADQAVKTYVPARIAVCLQMFVFPTRQTAAARPPPSSCRGSPHQPRNCSPGANQAQSWRDC